MKTCDKRLCIREIGILGGGHSYIMVQPPPKIPIQGISTHTHILITEKTEKLKLRGASQGALWEFLVKVCGQGLIQINPGAGFED